MVSTRLIRATIVLAALAVVPSAFAKTTDDLTDPGLYAIADGRAYPVLPVRIMLTAAKSTKAEATVAQMVDSLIDNQIIAAQAVKEYGKAHLLASSKVGFDTSVILEDQFTTLMRMHYVEPLNAFVQSLPGGKLDGLIVEQFSPQDSAIRELMTLRDIGEVRLTAAQLELAKKTPLARIRLPDGQEVRLSYADIYARLHVQGRVRILQERDAGYLLNQVRSRAESLFVDWWSRTKSGLKAADIALLRTLLEEKYLRGEYLLETGVSTAMHEDTTPTMEKLQKQVSEVEIAAWYEKNRDEFRQVERVRARHIRCRTEADCQAARKAVEAGLDFSEAARKYSVAPSKSATPAGSLGWIERKDNRAGWLGEVAMIGHRGEITGPIREPQDDAGNADWQLVLVDERVEGYAPLESETVRYQARQEIARRKAVERFKVMLESRRNAMTIRRNAALIAGQLGK